MEASETRSGGSAKALNGERATSLSTLRSIEPKVYLETIKHSLITKERSPEEPSFPPLLARCLETPALLQTMPARDSTTPNPAVLQARSEWLTANGINPAEASSGQIDPATLRNNFTPRIRELCEWFDIRTDRPIPVMKLLEVLQLNTDEQLFWQKTFTEATSLMKKHLPEALPSEPTTVIPEYINMPEGSPVEGWYFGKLRGNHIIKISVPTGSEDTDLVINPYRQLTPQQEKYILMTTLHELTHQRTSETIGPVNYTRVDLDSLFFDDQLSSLAPQELTDKIDLQKRIHQGYRPAPDLFQVMDEGIATSVEQALSSRHIRDLRLNGEDVEADEFKEVQRARFDSLRDERDALNEEAFYAVYSTGFAIIGNLARSLGQEKLLKYLQKIDIDKARAILIGSTKFNNIINSQNPSKLIPQKRR